MNLSKSISSLTSWSSSLSSWSEQQQQQIQLHQHQLMQQNIINNQQLYDQSILEQQHQSQHQQCQQHQSQQQFQQQHQQQYLSFQFKRPITGIQNLQFRNKPLPNTVTLGSSLLTTGSFIMPVNKFSRKVFIGGLPPDIDESN